jgi:hypothetical protein
LTAVKVEDPDKTLYPSFPLYNLYSINGEAV